MDKSKVQEWLDSNIDPLKKQFGLSHWNIKFEVCHIDGVMGRCNALPDYERARLKFNYDLIENEKELEEVVKHELMHIVHSPFNLFTNAVFEAIDDKALCNTLRKLGHNTAEMVTRNLERMHEGHKEFYGQL